MNPEHLRDNAILSAHAIFFIPFISQVLPQAGTEPVGVRCKSRAPENVLFITQEQYCT